MSLGARRRLAATMLWCGHHSAASNAVDGITFDAQPAEFFALQGPNGAGRRHHPAEPLHTHRPSLEDAYLEVVGWDIEA